MQTGEGSVASRWRPDQESNLDLPLRRRPFYPLNYRGADDEPADAIGDGGGMDVGDGYGQTIRGASGADQVALP